MKPSRKLILKLDVQNQLMNGPKLASRLFWKNKTVKNALNEAEQLKFRSIMLEMLKDNQIDIELYGKDFWSTLFKIV